MNCLIENNRCTRIGINNGVAYESGGFDISMDNKLVLLNNRIDRGGKDPVTITNDGETIMAQDNIFQQDTGVISSATATTITDPDQDWSYDYGQPVKDWAGQKYHVAVVYGRGARQMREITANTSNTLTVSPAWDVVPEKGSRYTVIIVSYRNLVKGNILSQHPQGIMYYDVSMRDIDIVDNTLIDSGGIWIRQMYRANYKPRERFQVAMDTVIADNTVADILGMYTWTNCYAKIFMQAESHNFGISNFSSEIRDNILIAPVPNRINEGFRLETVSNSIANLGTIFQGNKAVNTITAYDISAKNYNTVIWDSILQGVTNYVSDSGVNTIIGTAR